MRYIISNITFIYNSITITNILNRVWVYDQEWGHFSHVNTTSSTFLPYNRGNKNTIASPLGRAKMNYVDLKRMLCLIKRDCYKWRSQSFTFLPWKNNFWSPIKFLPECSTHTFLASFEMREHVSQESDQKSVQFSERGTFQSCKHLLHQNELL